MADETDNIGINVNVNPQGAESGSRRARTAVGGIGKEAQNLQSTFSRLMRTVDPLWAAQEKYNKTLADARNLYAQNAISGREFAQITAAGRAELEKSRQVIERNSASGRQAAAEARARANQEKIDAAATAKAVRDAEREKTAARKQAEREAAAAVREAKRVERELNREAAAEAKRLAREKADAERAANREAAEAVKAAKREERTAIAAAAAAAKQAAKDKRDAERQAAAAGRAHTAQIKEQAAAEKAHAVQLQMLRGSIDPVFAAQTRYNEVMRQATGLLMQNKLQQGEWTKIQQQAKAQMDVNVRSMGRLNSVYVQMGYQAQDVTASLASGINPLVILAQQGGQTAAALSQMGGVVGRVASFMAGPWGAAILGFTMLIGMLLMKNKEAEKATLDLLNAEKVRAATLKDLRDALEDFNKEQERSNQNQREALELDQKRAAVGYDEARSRVAKAEEAVNAAVKAAEEARKRAATASMGNAGEAARGQLAMAEGRLKAARKTLKEAQDTLELARRAQQEVEIRTVKGRVEAATDARAAIKQSYEDEETRLQRIYRQETKNLDPKRDSVAVLAAEARLAAGLLVATNKREAAEKKLADSIKEQNAEYGKGVAIFKSRQDAIGIAGRELIGRGMRVSENNQFGGVTGGHANNSAHGQFAIDVNAPGDESDPGVRSRFDDLARQYQARGYRVLWGGKVYEAGGNGPGATIRAKKGAKGDWAHQRHMHIEAPASLVGKPTQSGMNTQDAAAEREAAAAAEAARKDALDSLIEDLSYKQDLAREDWAEQLRLQDEKIVALRAFHGDESREVIRAQRERSAIERAKNQELLNIQREGIRARAEAAMAEVETQRAVADAGLEMARDNLQSANELGLIADGREEIAARRAIQEQEYALEVAHQQRMYDLRLKALQDTLATYPPQSKEAARVNGEIEVLKATHLNNMRLLEAQNTVAVNRLNLEMVKATGKAWETGINSVGNSLNTVFQNIWMRQGTFLQDMVNLADQLVFTFAQAGMKMLQDWAMNEVRKTAATIFGNTQRTTATTAAVGAQTAVQATQAPAAIATEAAITAAKTTGDAIRTTSAATAAATQGAVSTAAGTAEIGNQAAQAAAGAYKSTVVIPFIGPVAAPAAAALALGAVMGFTALIRSAKGGYGDVEGDQLMQVHNKEMILPAYIAEPLRNSLRRPSSAGLVSSAGASGADARAATHMNRGGDSNFYYQPQNNLANMGFDELLRRDGATLRKWLRNQHRNGALQGK